MVDKQPPKTKKYFRPTESGAGMTKAGTARYRRENPGSKLKTAVTGKVKKGSKDAKRRKSYCARSAGQMNPRHLRLHNSTTLVVVKFLQQLDLKCLQLMLTHHRKQ